MNEPSDLKAEVRGLAEARGWPQLGLEGSPLSNLLAGALLGLFIGMGILVLFTRGNFEGVLVLLGGGGSGVGLIILAVTIGGGAVWGLVNAKRKEVKAGPEGWNRWLAGAGHDDLNKAKARLQKQA